MSFGFIKKLYWQVLIGVLAGIAVGYFFPESALVLKPYGDGFIKLLKMVIAPIIFCTLVVGMAGITDMKKMSKMGLQSIIYFEIMTSLALLVGIVVMNFFPIGNTLHINFQELDVSGLAKFTSVQPTSFTDIFLKIIPESFIGAFADNEMLQILMISIVFGVALNKLGGQKNPLYPVIESASELFFKMIGMFMTLAPLGAFAAMAFTVGRFGIISLLPLAKFVLLFWATCAFFIIVFMGAILAYYKINIFQMLSALREEILTVMGIASSEPMIPRLIERLEERYGIKKDISGFILPAGSAFNLDGSCLYFTMAALFLAQATDTTFSLANQISLFLMLLITSKGANAVYGSAFVILGSTLGAVGYIPVESMAIILGIDRFMAIGRTTVNMLGNCTATIVLAKQNKDI